MVSRSIFRVPEQMGLLWELNGFQESGHLSEIREFYSREKKLKLASFVSLLTSFASLIRGEA